MELIDAKLMENVQFVALNELSPNAGHIAVEYRNCMLIWGGYNYDKDGQYYRPPDFLYIHPSNLFGTSNTWIKYKLKGDIPRATTASCGLIFGDVLFTFGGNIVVDDHALDHVRSLALPTNSFYGLDLRSGNWSEISDSTQKLPTPRDKATGFSCSKGLFYFGGYGPGSRHLRHPENYLFKNDDFLEDDELLNSCWNNQLLHFDGKKWNLIEQSGNVPPQRAAASIAYNPETNKAYLFGGRHSTIRLNDLYEMDVGTYKWRELKFGNDIPKPIGRSWATLTYNPDANYFLLYGGISANDYPLNERIKLTFTKSETCQAEYLEMTKSVPEKRLWHSTLYISGTFFSYGGMKSPPSGPNPPCTNSMEIVKVSPTSLKVLAMRKVAENLKQKHIYEFPYLLQAKLLMLIAKQKFVESIQKADDLAFKDCPKLSYNIERHLPCHTSLQVLFNALDA
uniref:Kelch repeat protein n=1 Tax=Panagrolaimus superbus TaxID=310955 RepID=A0A914ZBZ0_9BILA